MRQLAMMFVAVLLVTVGTIVVVVGEASAQESADATSDGGQSAPEPAPESNAADPEPQSDSGSTPQIPVLALSASREPEKLAGISDSGADEILTTGISCDELLDAARRLIES